MKSIFFYLMSVVVLCSGARAYDQIDRYFEIESRQRTVDEAMRVKEAALQYASNLSDFERVARYAFANPSDGYRRAVSTFIAKWVNSFVRHSSEFSILNRLESKTISVDEARRVKEAGVPKAYDIYSFEELIRIAFVNPSQAYREMVSDFIAVNARFVISSHTPIQEILRLEAHTFFVNHAIAVKTAGLVTVRNKIDLFDLIDILSEIMTNTKAENIRATL